MSSTDDKEKSLYSAPALTKGLDVLELLAVARTPMTMKEIAAGLGRSKNEIFRMLVALQERAYITRDPETDAFSLTDRLFTLGLHAPRQQDLLSVVTPELSLIAQDSRQSPHLVVLHHGLTVVVAAVPGGDDMSFTLRLGYGRPAVDATSGHVILAFQPPATARRIIEESEARSPSSLDQVEFYSHLEAIRTRGYELRSSRDFVGITDICCPIYGADGNAVAAIIIAYVNRHKHQNQHEATLDVLRAACTRISARLSAHVQPVTET